MTLAMAIVADIISPRERGRYQGYIQMVFVVASVAGPLLGGLFADHLSWRWVFYVNLPIGIVALTVISTTLALHDDGPPPADRLARRRAARRRDHLGPARHDVGRAPLRVGLGRDPRPGRRRGRAARRVRRPGAPRAGADPAAAPVPRPRLRRRLGRRCSSRRARSSPRSCSRRCTCRSSRARAPTDSGLLLLPLLLAADREHRDLRAPDLAHRPLQALPGRRPGDHGRRPVPAVADGHGHAARDDRAVLVVLRPRVRDGLAGADARDPERRRAAATSASRPGRRTCSARSAARSASRSSARSSPRASTRRLPRCAVGAARRCASSRRARRRSTRCPPPCATAIAEAVAHALHSVFLVAAPVALLGLAVVLLLREVPLRGPGGPPAERRPRRAPGPRRRRPRDATAGASR